ncbi:uncharacterized protein LOC135710429 [Ochlerotatus camptorhynchus]|uniref:uncharacterized protein LOC135710429 n=1 Tax=Ochlerotatus camptorhynchus TaxID=644619 RepID=UPI0031D0370A
MMIASSRFSKPCLVEVQVEGINLNMEIDCGAAVTVISLETYRKYFKNIEATICSSRLVVVNGQQLKIFGDVFANNVQHQVTLIILDCSRSFVPLFGRNWLDAFYPSWRSTFGNVISINTLKKTERNLEQKHALGFEADLVLREERPIFRKAYDVPFKLREKVIEHLDSLEKQNVISPIQAQL